MSKKLYKVFEEVEARANLSARYWRNFYAEISRYLPDTYQSDMSRLSENLENSLEKLVSELRNPTLTIATTGTTSSGKSTLVNLLCGAEIVPVAVSEMSAGAVTIEYSEEKSLIIHETPGAVWECGEWENISEEEIYQHLHQTMISFLDSRQEQPNLACPQSLIKYPFRLLKEEGLDLTPGTRVRILDLPGLSYVGDERNANVIRQCREALCIVTYNSAENDPVRVKSLLQEVIQQVKDLGGSPARMLFVLNRIDVFREDRNWPDSENRFVINTINNIKNELTERLKEYTEEIENLQVVKLSTRPALKALQIKDDNDIRSTNACRDAKNFCGVLIEEVLDDLVGNPQKWSRHDRHRVAEMLWEKSYAEEFHKYLRDHITQNFPQLVIPQIIERFNVDAGNAVVEWAKQTTTAILNSTEELYHQECANIVQMRSSIERFLEISDANLREPFKKIDNKIKQALAEESKEDIVRYLENTIKEELENVNPYNSLGEKLSPLYGWRRELGQGINQVLEAVAKSLETGKIELESTNLRKANHLYIKLLENNLSRLMNLGYTSSIAKEGGTIEARTEVEKSKLKQLNEELNELALHLNLVMEDIVNQISKQELSRMYQAVVELFNCHLSHIEQGSNNIAPDIAIKFPESQLNKVGGQPKFNIRFQAGFAVTEGNWKEKVEVGVRKRVFWKLWLGKATVKEIKYESRISDNAEIPSVEYLLAGWTTQARDAEPEIVNQIIHWLLKQLDDLKKNVDLIQNEIIDRYQERLDKANQEITLDTEKQRSIWHPMKEKAQELAEEFSNIGTILKEES